MGIAIRRQLRILFWLCLLAFLGSCNCGTSHVTQTGNGSRTPTSVSSETKSIINPTASPAIAQLGWREYRDHYEGWSIAVPEEWIVASTGPSTLINQTTIKNYSEEYYSTHHDKDGWISPEIAEKAKSLIIVLVYNTQEIELERALEKYFRSSTPGAGSIQMITSLEINGAPAAEFIYSAPNANATPDLFYGIKLQGNNLMLIYPIQQDTEIHAIVNSLVLPITKKVVLPEISSSAQLH